MDDSEREPKVLQAEEEEHCRRGQPCYSRERDALSSDPGEGAVEVEAVSCMSQS